MSRQDRRANPDQWWKLSGYFDASTKKVHGLDEKYAQYVKGSIGDIVVIEIPANMPSQDRNALMSGFQEMAAGLGEQHRFMFVPDNIRFLKVSPVDRDTSRHLDRQAMNRRVDASVRAARADQNRGSGEEPS